MNRYFTTNIFKEHINFLKFNKVDKLSMMCEFYKNTFQLKPIKTNEIQFNQQVVYINRNM